MAAGRTGSRGNYARGLATRSEIVTIASSVLVERGFYGASMGTIAERAQLTPAGVQHHFPTKEHLLLAVLDRYFRRGSSRIDEQLDQGRSVLDAMLDMLRANMRSPQRATLLMSFAGASVDPSHPAHDWFVDRYTYVRERLISHVERGQRSGQIRTDIPADQTAVQLIAMFEGLLMHWLHEREAFDVVGAMEAFMDGLRTPQTQPD